MASMLDLDAVVDALVARPDLIDRLRSELGRRSDGLVSVTVAAGMLGVAEKTVRNWLSEGRLTPYGAPRRRLVAVVEIDELRTNGRLRTFSERARHE